MYLRISKLMAWWFYLCAIWHFSAMFVDFLYDHFDDPGAVHIIWSDGPSSEIKNKFMVKFFEQKLWVRGWQNHYSVIKWFFKSSRAATKQNISDSFNFIVRIFFKITRSYWLEPDKITITGSGNMIRIQFKHSGGEKETEFSCKIDESIKLTTDGCILLILCSVDIFDVVFLLFFKWKN